jgi:hypothetical protein
MSPHKSMSHNEAVEDPRQLGERYFQELRDLVDEGKIPAVFAQRVMEDLFEAGEAGQLLLKKSVLASYIDEQQQLGLISVLQKLSS